MSAAVIVDAHGKPYPRSERGKYLNTGYTNGAASLDSASMQGWNWWGGSPDDDIVANLPIIRQRCRDLSMNAPIVAGMISTITTNVIGQGLIPEPTPDTELLGMSLDEATAWKRAVLRYWEEFSESKECDVHRRDNFYEIQQLAHRAVIESGDVFVTLPYVQRSSPALLDLRIQVIEADAISNPRGANYLNAQFEGETGDIFGGVEVGKYGEVIAYHVATVHPLAKRNSIMRNRKPFLREWIRVPVFGEQSGRRNILHIMRSMRPGQRRGVPVLAPIVEAIKMLDRYMKAELQAALVQTLFTAAIKTSMPEGAVGEWNAMMQQIADGDPFHTPSQRFYEQHGTIQMGAGTIGFLAPGDEIQPVGVTHPAPSFGPFAEAELKMIGSALGLPYEMSVMTFSTSFSASRAAMNMATANFKTQRDWMTYSLCQPVYEEFMANIVAKNYVKAPGFFTDPIKRRAYCLAKWSGPADLQIDPLKELQAYEKGVGLGAMTYSDVANKFGSDFRQNASVLHEEQQIYNNAPWDRNPLKVSTVKEGDEGGDTTQKPAK